MNHQKAYLQIKILLIVGLISLFWVSVGRPALAQDPVQVEENEPCLVCHNNPELILEFPDGSTTSAHVSEVVYQNSVHGRDAMTCGGCHPDHSSYPHPEVTAANDREYTMQLNQTCYDCHPDQVERVQDSTHAHLRAEGNEEAAVCVDCHGAHNTLSLHEARVQIATTCRQCHSGIYDEYRHSVHGSALWEEHNSDVPTCVDCHGSHTMEDPRTAEFRLNSPNLCGSCHADEALMSKYGISTDVFETYVADFHGTTVTLFEKQSPDAATNKAVCYDCHGIHDIRAMDDPASIAASKQNLLVTCQKCHPDATINFPDSWASHYQPTFDKQPLVSTVNLFYLLLIPGVIGFMVLFVVADAGHNIISRGKPDEHGTPSEQAETTAEPTTPDEAAPTSGETTDNNQEGA